MYLQLCCFAGSSSQPHEASHGYLNQELDQLKDLTTCQLDCMQAQNGSSSIAYPPYSIAHGVRGTIKQPYALGKKTIAMSARGVDGELLYNTHNIYGLSEAAATHAALKTILGKRPFILTR
jgi:alpha-glucosidase (family GH31 glycosyl hydrolase)